MVIDKEDFKKEISDALFEATKSEELTPERCIDVAEQICERILDAAKNVLLI